MQLLLPIALLITACGGQSEVRGPDANQATTSSSPGSTASSASPTPSSAPSTSAPATPSSTATPPAPLVGQSLIWNDDVEVSILRIKHANMTAEDVEDSDPDGKKGEALVRFYFKVTNGSDSKIEDLYGEATVTYGPDGLEAEERFPVYQDAEDIDNVGAGKSKTVTSSYAIPVKYQGQVTVDFELDSDHEAASFSGSAK